MTSKLKIKINQAKLEIGVALFFGLAILILSSTEVGYIPITPERYMDLGIIPAVFAAMIGGYRVGIPIAFVWALIAYFNPASHLQIYGLAGLIINRLTLVMTIAYSYKQFKRIFQYSPYNVYWSIFVAVTAKNLTANSILLYQIPKESLVIEVWLSHAVQQYLLEMGLCMLAMFVLVKHLRQVHILNGIKRKEKRNAGQK